MNGNLPLPEEIGVQIDEEFEALCPPLSPEELNLLEDSLSKDGCRDPLIVWHERELLLDGHNRKRICDDLGIAYRLKVISLPNRHAAMDWIINNQLGRRNLTEEQKSYLRGKKYNERKKAQGGDRKSNGHSDHLIGSTAKQIASETGVGEKTVRRDAKFAESVDSLDAEMPGLKQEVLSGTSRMSKKEIVEAANPPEKFTCSGCGEWEDECICDSERSDPRAEEEDQPQPKRWEDYLEEHEAWFHEELDVLHNDAELFEGDMREQLYHSIRYMHDRAEKEPAFAEFRGSDAGEEWNETLATESLIADIRKHAKHWPADQSASLLHALWAARRDLEREFKTRKAMA